MRRLIFIFAFLLVLSGPGSTVPAQDPAIYTMVAELRRQSHADALIIKEEYRPLIDTAVFENLDHLRRATEAGELVPLSSVALPHIQPRLSGVSPIAQKDPENQHLYVAVRPAAIGVLIDLTRRIAHGPLEVTSLVRTSEYQRALMRGNGNANTDVPTHTMGYAVDIGLKYATPDTANELRRVLEEMRAAGDVYFIVESNQLTVHIVPVPARIPHFDALYQQTVAEAAQEQAPPPPTEQPQSAAGSRLAGVWTWITNLFD